MNTLNYILEKYQLENFDFIEIPNVGRDTLASILPELGFRRGVEIGVKEGLYSEVLCRENPQMELFGVDPWLTFMTCKTPVEGGRETWCSQENCDKYYGETKERLSKFPNYTIIRKSSMDAVKDFEDESLDFVYIDGNHDYSYVTEDITEWLKKLRKGGIMSGHDFFTINDPRALVHVKRAVLDFVRINSIKPLIIWGINAKIPGTIRDRLRSWSWIKQ